MTNCCWWEIQCFELIADFLCSSAPLLYIQNILLCCEISLEKSLLVLEKLNLFIYYFTWVGCLNISLPLFHIFQDQTVFFHCSPKAKESRRLSTKPSQCDRNFNKIQLATKARFARVRAARGWIPAYQATSIDLTLQSHTLDPTSGLSFLRLVLPIRLLVKDSLLSMKMVHVSS